MAEWSALSLLLMFLLAAAAVWIAGIWLSDSTDVPASRFGLGQAMGGIVVLAVTTNRPEISTGLASIRLGDYQLAMDDIFGGNAFLPCLFLLASIVSGNAVLPHAQNSDVCLASLGVVLTAIYTCGLDSWVVVVVYLLGMVGLSLVPT